MPFTTWAAEYEKAKNALAARTWDQYFLQSVTDQEEMRTTYTKLGNVTAFVDWLASKASEEALGLGEGVIPMFIGGS